MNLAAQKVEAVKAYLDRFKAGLPWTVERHRTDPSRGQIVDRFGNNISTNLSLGVAEFMVERVNRDDEGWNTEQRGT